MLSYIKGKISDNKCGKLTIITSLDIGFCIYTANGENFKIGETIELHLYVNWNQEQGPSIFGFLTNQEKIVFELLLECPGIGPKVALSILNQARPDMLIEAISQSDTKFLSSLSGIGPKKAEQIVFQTKDKLLKIKEQFILSDSAVTKHLSMISQVLSSLNYSKSEVSHTLDYISTHNKDPQISFDELLRKSLAFLSKRA